MAWLVDSGSAMMETKSSRFLFGVSNHMQYQGVDLWTHGPGRFHLPLLTGHNPINVRSSWAQNVYSTFAGVQKRGADKQRHGRERTDGNECMIKGEEFLCIVLWRDQGDLCRMWEFVGVMHWLLGSISRQSRADGSAVTASEAERRMRARGVVKCFGGRWTMDR